MQNVVIEISKDFGDWDRIEQFRWGLYAQEIEQAARVALAMPDVDIRVDYVLIGKSTVIVDGFSTEAEYHVVDSIFNHIDATDARFYEWEVN